MPEAEALTARLTRRIFATGAVLTVALAPYDLVLIRERPDAAHALQLMRLATLGLCGLFFLMSYTIGRRLGSFWTAAIPYLLQCVAIGAATGMAARRDDYWLMTLQFVPVACGVVFIPLFPRALLALLCSASALAGFSLTFDGQFTERYVVHTLGLLALTSVFAMFGGNELYRQAFDAYRLQRALAQKRAELGEVNATLEARVEAQTRDLRHLAARIDDVLEAERRRFAGELHDDLGQELTALRLELDALDHQAQGTRFTPGLQRAAAAVERSHVSVRRMLESLRPRILDEEGLSASIVWLARQLRERTALVCKVQVEILEEPDERVGLVAFRVVQEALTNVARHAEASLVEIDVRGDHETIFLRVEDNGRGLPSLQSQPRHGLVGMRERALSVGGTLAVERSPSGGTLVEATVPLARGGSQPGTGAS